jgi:hypothetical protein
MMAYRDVNRFALEVRYIGGKLSITVADAAPHGAHTRTHFVRGVRGGGEMK